MGCLVCEIFAYIAGDTESADFPTKTAFQNALQGDGDAFVASLDTNGDALVYSSYLGGGGVASESLDTGLGSLWTVTVMRISPVTLSLQISRPRTPFNLWETDSQATLASL